jgi:Cu/Ag efflux protein CusF
MKKALAIAIAAAFAAVSFGALAQDKKKEDVKAKQGGEVKSAGGAAVTTADKKTKDNKGAAIPMPENQGKRKDEKQRTEKK